MPTAKGKAAAKPSTALTKRQPRYNGKHPGGRPPTYDPARHCARATRLALLGLTNDDIAQALEITTSTFAQWQKDHQEFSDAIAEGKVDADAKVAQSLYKRAVGMATPAVKIFMPKDATDASEAIIVPHAVHHPPDVNAARMWLHNRRPKDWRERREIEVTGGLEFRIAAMSPDERLARLIELQAKAALVIEGEASEIPEE